MLAESLVTIPNGVKLWGKYFNAMWGNAIAKASFTYGFVTYLFKQIVFSGTREKHIIFTYTPEFYMRMVYGSLLHNRIARWVYDGV